MILIYEQCRNMAQKRVADSRHGKTVRMGKKQMHKKRADLSVSPLFTINLGCCFSAQTFFDTCRLTGTLTQVVQFGLTYGTTAFNSNAVDYW